MNNGDALPSTGRLFGEALQHWSEHQGRFWVFAGPVMVILGVLNNSTVIMALHNSVIKIPSLQYLIVEYEFYLISLSGVQTLLNTLVLYQWFKYTLYEDWTQRRLLLWQEKRIPFEAFVSAGFVAFRVAYHLFSNITSLALNNFVSIWITPWSVAVLIMLVKDAVLALIFSGFLLFLPACAVGIAWGPWRALQAASGLRGRLFTISLLLAYLLVVASKTLWTVDDAISSRFQDMSWGAFTLLQFAKSLAHGFLELLTLYLLAYAVSRLFIITTRWKPTPLLASSDA